MKFRKIYIAITLFILLYSYENSLFAQKCKFNVDEVNPISGERLIKTATIKAPNLRIAFCRKGDELFIESNIRFSGEKNSKIDSGLVITFRLEDNTLVKFRTKEITYPTSEANQYGIWTYYYLFFYGSKEDFELLSKVKPKAAAISADNKDFYAEPIDKLFLNIPEFVSCLLLN